MQKVQRKENILERNKTHEHERHTIINVLVYSEFVKIVEAVKANIATK